MDEMVPVRRCGRPVRVFEKGSTFVSDPGICRKCARCPKYEPRKLWCPLRAEMRQPEAPACRYGIVLMGVAKQKEYKNGRGEKEA